MDSLLSRVHPVTPGDALASLFNIVGTYATFAKSFLPSVNLSQELGSLTAAWARVYAGSAHVVDVRPLSGNRAIFVPDNDVSVLDSSLVPLTDWVRNFGSITNRWSNIYGNTYYGNFMRPYADLNGTLGTSSFRYEALYAGEAYTQFVESNEISLVPFSGDTAYMYMTNLPVGNSGPYFKAKCGASPSLYMHMKDAGTDIQICRLTPGNFVFEETPVSSTSGGVDMGEDARRWGTVYCGSVNTGSDERIKKDIEPIDTECAMKFVKNLKPRFFKYKNGSSGRVHSGFIAQEVRDSIIECNRDPNKVALWTRSKRDVNDENDPNFVENMEGLVLSEFIPYLVAAIQSLEEEVRELRGS